MSAGRPRQRVGHVGDEAGFTVIEMMVVLAIVVVIVALVAPSFRDMIERQRVRGIATELAADLNFARSEAVRRNRNVFFELDGTSTQTCYVIYVQGIDASCSCRRSGSSCVGDAEEIRTQRIARSVGASLSSVTATREVRFNQGLGLPAVTDFGVDVTGRNALLRVSVGAAGRVNVCTPDGSLPGMPTCS